MSHERIARSRRRRYLALWQRHYRSKRGRQGWISPRTWELLHGKLPFSGEVGRISGVRIVERR